MADINSLVITVKSDGVEAATKRLNDLGSAADGAEAKTKKLSNSASDSADKQEKASQALWDNLVAKAAQFYSNVYDKQLQQNDRLYASLQAEANRENALFDQRIAATRAQMEKLDEIKYADNGKAYAAAQAEAIAMNNAMDKMYKDAYAMNEAFNAKRKAQEQAQIETISVMRMKASNSEYAQMQQDAKRENALFDQRAAASAKAFAEVGPSRTNLDQFNQSGEKFIANLKAQTDTLGMTAKQLRAYQVEVLKAKAEQLGVSDSASGMIKKFEESSIAAGHASSGAAGIGRELIVLGHEMSQGQFTRFGGSLIVMAERINFIPALLEKMTEGFAKLGLSLTAGLTILGGVTAALALMGAAAVSASHDFQLFRDTMSLTGGSAGATIAGLEGIARAAAASGGSLMYARDIVAQFAATGKFTADEIKKIAPALTEMDHASSATAEKFVESFKNIRSAAENTTARSADAVTRSVLEMNGSYHLLNSAQMETVAQLERQGNALDAARYAMDKMSDAIHTRAEEAVKDLTPFGEKLNEIKKGAEAIWEALKAPFQTRIPDITTQIEKLKGQQELILYAGGTKSDAKYQEIQAHIMKLVNQGIAEEAAAKAKGAKDQLVQEQAIAAKSVQNTIDSNNAKAVAMKKYEEFTNEYHKMSDAEQLRLQKQYIETSDLLWAATQDKPVKDNRIDSSKVEAQVKAQADLIRIAKDGYDNQNRLLDEAHRQSEGIDADYYEKKRNTLTAYSLTAMEAVAKQIAAENNALSAGIYDKESQITDAQARVAALKSVWQKYADDAVAGTKLMYQKQESEYINYYDKLASTIQKQDNVTIDGLQRTLAAQKQHTAEIGLTKEQVEALRSSQAILAAQEMEERANGLQALIDEGGLQGKELELNQIHLADLREEIKLRKQISTEAANGAIKEADAQAAKDAFQAWKDTNRKIGDDLANAIVDGGGKGWKKMLHDMEVAFAKAVLQPILAPISGGIASLLNPTASQAGGVATAANAAMTGNSFVSLAAGAGNLYSAITGGMTLAGGVGTGFVGSLAGALNGAGAGSGLTSTLGASIGEGILGVVGPGMASTISTAIGGIAAALPWVGGALAIGSMWKSAFGHGPKNIESQGISGMISDSGTTGQAYQNWREKGGWFRGDNTGQDSQSLSKDITNSMSSSLVSLKAAASDSAKTLGVTSEALIGYSKTFDITLTSDIAKNQQAITDFFTQMGDDMATKLIPNIADFAKSGETASVTLQRLSDTFKATDQIVSILGTTATAAFGSVGLASDAARERLVELSGGLQSLSNKTTAYMSAIYSDSEKLAPVQKAVSDAMASLGLSSITTKEQFKQTVDGIVSGGGLMTNAGTKLFNSLMDLAPAFGQVADAAEAATKASQDQAAADAKAAADALAKKNTDAMDAALSSADTALSRLKTSIDNQKTLITAAYDAQEKAVKDTAALQLKSAQVVLDNAKSNLSSIQSALKSSQSNSFTLTSANRSEAVATLQQAMKSGVLGGNDFQSALDNISKPSEQLYSSFVDYARDQAKNSELLSNLESQAKDQVDVAQSTIDAINASSDAQVAAIEAAKQAELASLDNIYTQAQAQLDALKGIDNSLLSLGNALASFKGAAAGASAQQISNSTGSSSAAITSLYNTLLNRAPEAGAVDFWNHQLSIGRSLSNISQDFINSPEYKSLHPSFAVGTNDLPTDMLANVHKGERIIPAADNSEIIRRLGTDKETSSSNSDVIQAIDSLKDVIMTGDISNVKMNKEVYKILKKWDLDGQPETRNLTLGV